MKIQKFQDIKAWQKSQDLAFIIYSTFSPLKEYGFKDQLTRAVVSISNNIAEGFDRSSSADFNKFLYFAMASCSEVRSMLYLAERLNYISPEARHILSEQTNEI